MFLTVALLLTLNTLSALGQLSGRVGPTTSRSAKRNTICNVLNYGGSVGSSVSVPLTISALTLTDTCAMQDIGPAIPSAFNNCVLKNKGSTLYIPPGNYNMATWVTLNGATQWALQLDGIISRTGMMNSTTQFVPTLIQCCSHNWWAHDCR